MALSELHALRRAQDTCVKTPRILAWIRAFHAWLRHLRHPHVSTLDPHLLRDIGLTEQDIAAMKHQHPSQTTSHPRT